MVNAVRERATELKQASEWMSVWIYVSRPISKKQQIYFRLGQFTMKRKQALVLKTEYLHIHSVMQ